MAVRSEPEDCGSHRLLLGEQADRYPDWVGVVTQTEELHRRHGQLREISCEVIRIST